MKKKKKDGQNTEIPEFLIDDKGILKKYNGIELHVMIPDTVTSIGDGAFKNNKNLISVTFPEGINSIGHYAFSGCRKLTSLVIPDSVKSIGDYAFKGCKCLSNLDVPNNVQRIGKGACNMTTIILY